MSGAEVSYFFALLFARFYLIPSAATRTGTLTSFLPDNMDMHKNDAFFVCVVYAEVEELALINTRTDHLKPQWNLRLPQYKIQK